jgi:hypothetical protein
MNMKFAKNPTKTPRQKSAKNSLRQKLPKTSQKLPPTKTPQKLSVRDYTILMPFLLPPLYIFFVFFLATPSNIGENREIASPH